MQSVEYPIFITIPETQKILGLGRTTVYKLIDLEQLEKVKLGRCSRVTLSSVIHFSYRAIQDARFGGAKKINFPTDLELEPPVIPDHFASLLCHTHCEDFGEKHEPVDGGSDTSRGENSAGSSEKNFAGGIR